MEENLAVGVKRVEEMVDNSEMIRKNWKRKEKIFYVYLHKHAPLNLN